ncbi:helix-turn-helix domain-containing protein [Calothrix sp. HK-06]|nr:helix-turn-helix domain-containing protein [Calothrix sp. HK-06]
MKLATEAQIEQLREIGAYLRKRREDKSISIDEIAVHTRIRPAFIQAIEEGNAEVLPEAVFVQGFIRRYCDAIGIDGAALTTNFGDVFLPVPTESEPQDIEKKQSLYIPLAVPYILLLVAASLGLIYILVPRRGTESVAQSKSNTTRTAVISKTSPVVSLPNPTSSPTSSPIASASPSPTLTSTPQTTPIPTPTPTIQAGEGVEVGVELQDSSWIRVKVDGNTDFEGTLNKGEKRTWKALKEVSIRSGNAGAVLVSPNKQPATAMGTQGSVREVKYTPETAATPTPSSTP